MSSLFEELETIAATRGPAAAVDHLNAELERRRDFHALFHGLILKTRMELGLPLVQGFDADGLPCEVRHRYEEGIRRAARIVGQAFLQQDDLAGAWPYYRMIQEVEPVAGAIERVRPDPDDPEAWQTLIGIAWNEGVHPRRGFDLILERFGTCSAITSFGQAVPENEDVRNYCIQALVRDVYRETCVRVQAEIERREKVKPGDHPLVELIRGRPWLFEEDGYHIDLSHLSAVVEYAAHLPRCRELQLAIELCDYGVHLSPRFANPGDPPFEDRYRDFGIYLRALAGEGADAAVAHFQQKAESADSAEAGTLPGEVLVNLLMRLNRPGEAVQAYTRYLAQADPRRLSCPPLHELCAQAGDYRPYCEWALRRGDPVNFAAGLLHDASASPPATS